MGQYKKYKRIFTIVLDSLGVGAMEDSPQYGDIGVDTLFQSLWTPLRFQT